jgi:hypothetical protein
MKIRHILILCFSVFEANSFGHEQIVHQAITFNASESAYAGFSAYANFLNTVSPDLALKDATNALVTGSFDEDFNLQQDPVGGNRSLNHFYDPIHKVGGEAIGLTVGGVALGRNSLDWGSISNEPTVPHGWPINKIGAYNKWSWQNARGYEWFGLTATGKADRSAALQNMFQSVGQVMHLLEDTSQPQHVRNEQHLDQIPYLKMDLRSRSAIEDYGKKHVGDLKYAHSMLGWHGLGFTKLEDFWDRHLYNGDSTTLNNAEIGGAQLGLAEWCNGNFIGECATYAEFFDHSDPRYFPFPSLANTTQPNLQEGNLWGTAVHGDVTLENFKQGTRLYISKNSGAGVPVTYHSALSYLIAEHPGKSSGLPILTIADDNVLSNYHAIFIPKAVKYSAGLLDYFFRGQLDMSIRGGPEIGTVIFSITNTSSQPFKDGSFVLLKEDASDASGTRTVAAQYNMSDMGGTMASGDSTDLSYTDSTITTNTIFYMVYQGTIGANNGTASDPVDAGRAIAVKRFKPPTPSSCPFTDTIWEDPVYDTSLGPITSSATNNTIQFSGSYSSPTPTHLTSLYATGSFFYIGPTFDAYVHLDPNAYGVANGGAIQVEVKVFVDDEKIDDEVLPNGVFSTHGWSHTYYDGYTFTIPESAGVTVRTEVTCYYGNGAYNGSGFMDFGVVLTCGDAPTRPVYSSTAQTATVQSSVVSLN